jgi:ABC-2 type transport system ATP-binding protein
MTTELPIEKQKTQTKGDSANTKATSEGEVILEVRNLQKTYTAGLRSFHIERIFEKQKTVNAVKGISFDVFRGEIFGFLGPNGAGKTTTIKMLTGLIRRTGGTAKLLGLPIPSAEAMGRVGFLPENPYIYPYLTPREFVTLCGQLNGLSGAHLEKRVKECLERVGVAYAMDRDAKALSKGMLQRTALAAAIVHDPELLLLDEPMSGLDPVGRKEVRDIIAQEKEAGRTVFFSSHILSDVEMLCDRVCILRKGEVVDKRSLGKRVTPNRNHAFWQRRAHFGALFRPYPQRARKFLGARRPGRSSSCHSRSTRPRAHHRVNFAQARNPRRPLRTQSAVKYVSANKRGLQ